MIKHLDHLNMTVANLEESIRWYGDLFEFAVKESGTYKGAPWSILQSGDALLCMYEHSDYGSRSPEQTANHGVSHFGLRLNDRASFEARAKEMGVEIKFDGAFEWPFSTSFYVNDPTGYEIEVAAWHDDEVRFG